MKIGIFPGSFNPVHIGHLAVANYIVENEGYDELWFLITPQNPMKRKTDILDQELRLQMLEHSIKGYDKFKICTIEWDMPKPTYTINTLQKLRMMYPQYKFDLIIGSDNWQKIHRWKDYQMILKNYHTIVYPRYSAERIYITHPNAKLCSGAPVVEISATVIRKALRQQKDMRFYLPNGVYEMLIATGLFEYQEEEENTTSEVQDEEIEAN